MDIDVKLGSVFSDALSEVIATVSSVYLEALSSKDDSFKEMIGVMNLNGKKSGMLFVSANESDMRVLCSCMIGVPPAGVTKDDMEDALCEFVNMTAGNAKLRLSDTEYVYQLPSPFIIKGKNITIVAKRKMHMISKALGNGEISVNFKVVF